MFNRSFRLDIGLKQAGFVCDSSNGKQDAHLKCSQSLVPYSLEKIVLVRLTL